MDYCNAMIGQIQKVIFVMHGKYSSFEDLKYVNFTLEIFIINKALCNDRQKFSSLALLYGIAKIIIVWFTEFAIVTFNND